MSGANWSKVLEMGESRPWPEALETLTGEKQMDATAILDYFAPLKAWLDEQNKGTKWTGRTDRLSGPTARLGQEWRAQARIESAVVSAHVACGINLKSD